MAMTFDLSDVPTADAADLATAMRSLVKAGRGLVLLHGATEADLDRVRMIFQRRFHADPQRALAAFVRFRHLVAVFATRRLQRAVLEDGFAVMAPALAIAATLRLNGKRGFNPQRFLLALQAARADIFFMGPRARGPGGGRSQLAA
ncbi:MAG TPA: hypothetical protein VFF87_09470 [Hyphomicrobium sp.]|nr:hypothetical protein [Hyphomicrobium sp.]